MLNGQGDREPHDRMHERKTQRRSAVPVKKSIVRVPPAGITGTQGQPRNKNPRKPLKPKGRAYRIILVLIVLFSAFIIIKQNSKTLINPVIEKIPKQVTKTGDFYFDERTGSIFIGKAYIKGGKIDFADKSANGAYLYSFSYNLSDKLDSKEIKVSGDCLKKAIFSKETESLELTGKIPLVFDTELTEDGSMVVITPKNPKTKYIKIVVIDIGHGGSDAGAPAGVVNEKDINLIIGLKLYELLEESDSGIKAYLTRSSDYYPELLERAELASKIGDIFVSIHNNTYADLNSVNGTETYYNAKNSLSFGGESGRFRMSSKSLAETIQKNAVKLLGSKNRGTPVRNDLFILSKSTIPSALIEIGFLTNPAEREKLLTDEYCQKAAQGIYNGILDAFGN